MSIYKKLLQIQQHVNGLGKNQKAFGYDYVTGSKVLEHIKPKMNELGLILKQEILSIKNERQDYVTLKGVSKNEVLSKVMMRFTWIDCETGEKDENLFGANGQNDWDKGVGSALTYAERYFLLKYFHISTDEDDIDNPERKKEDVVTKPNILKAPNDLIELVSNALADISTMEDFKEFGKTQTAKDAQKYPELLTLLKSKNMQLKNG